MQMHLSYLIDCVRSSLSSGRNNAIAIAVDVARDCVLQGDAAVAAAHANSPNGDFANRQPEILPLLAGNLPLLGGEGWGEGELFLRLNRSGGEAGVRASFCLQLNSLLQFCLPGSSVKIRT